MVLEAQEEEGREINLFHMIFARGCASRTGRLYKTTAFHLSSSFERSSGSNPYFLKIGLSAVGSKPL